MIKADVSTPNFDYEFRRRQPLYTAFFENTPLVAYADNSGAAVPSTAFWENTRLTTGANGINKTQDYGRGFTGQGQVAPADVLAFDGDATSHGFWRRTLYLDCIVNLQAIAGTTSATMRAGIGIGTYGAVPPNPVTTLCNVVRVACRMDTMAWELITHVGDGVSAQIVTPIGITGTLARSYRVRVVHKSGEYVQAAVNNVSVSLAYSAVIPPTGANPSVVSCFVESGSASGNVRAIYTGMFLHVF